MPVVAQGIGHRFNQSPWLFRGFERTFEAGHVYALTGPSGSGKSTLLSILAKLEKPREGIIDFGGVSKISWVFQNPFGTPGRTALDHVALPILARNVTIREAESAGRELLAQFQLDKVADRPFRELSGGEGQRLMLARGLASKPGLLLVDEPTAQLDRQTAAQVDSVLGSMANADTVVIVATHDASTRDACTDHIDLSTFAEQHGPT